MKYQENVNENWNTLNNKKNFKKLKYIFIHCGLHAYHKKGAFDNIDNILTERIFALLLLENVENII